MKDKDIELEIKKVRESIANKIDKVDALIKETAPKSTRKKRIFRQI